MLRTRSVLLGILFGGLLAVAVGTVLLAQGREYNPPPPQTLPPDLTTTTNAFGFQMYGELARAKGGENLFISPLNLQTALGMVYNGAEGATREQMGKALGWTGATNEQVNRYLGLVAGQLRDADPKATVTTANALWVKQGAAFVPAYLECMKTAYAAEARAVDFLAPTTVPAMNAWVHAKTGGMIPTIVEDGAFDRLTRMVLMSALYFKGLWTDPFDAAVTTDGQFQAAGGAVPARMMNRNARFSYAQVDGTQLVRLPYGNGALALYVALPPHGTTASAWLGAMTPARWDAALARMRPTEGYVSLPRFTANTDLQLKDALSALGMGGAFAAGANFRGISTAEELYIASVRHKTALEVTEEGTRAAAVTSIEMRATSMPVDFFSMVVDRPFALAIRHEDSGTLLFLGTITKPQP